MPQVRLILTFVCVFFLQVTLVNGAAWRSRGDTPLDSGCSKPADILFLLDDSSSIWGPHFLDMISFCKMIVGEMNVGPQAVRVAAASFSEGAREEFNFNDYNTRDEVNHGLDTIHQSNGGMTETFLGLKFARETLFKDARSGVPHILILITDGVSYDRQKTLEEAKLTQAAGVEMIVIGVGKMDEQQLREITSAPVDEHFFTVGAFTQLSNIEALVKQKACHPKCQHHPAEVVFVIDRSTSIYIRDFQKQLQFVSDVINVFDVSPTMTRVAAVAFSTNASVEFHLDEYTDKANLMARTMKIAYTSGSTETAQALRLARLSVLTPAHGMRPDVAHIVIVITDGRSQKYHDTQREAAALKDTGAIVFAIGVGPNVDPVELQNIGSTPADKFVFKTSGYDALPSIKNVLAFNACHAPLPPLPPV